MTFRQSFLSDFLYSLLRVEEYRENGLYNNEQMYYNASTTKGGIHNIRPRGNSYLEARDQMMNVQCSEGKGNMRTLEQKVDILVRYCAAESEQVRRYYHADLQSILADGGPMDVRRSIDRALSDLGIPDHLLGYAYLQSAITLVVQQPDAAYAVTSCIYPTVAMRFSTTAQLVERAIRHAVERGWSRCDSTMREMYFGGKIRPNRQKPTNAEFIARIANLVRG